MPQWSIKCQKCVHNRHDGVIGASMGCDKEKCDFEPYTFSYGNSVQYDNKNKEKMYGV